MADGNAGLAIAISALLLLVSLGGAGFYLINRAPDSPPADEGNNTPTEPIDEGNKPCRLFVQTINVKSLEITYLS